MRNRPRCSSLVLMLASAVIAFGQQSSSQLSGTVTDEMGAVIQEVRIILTDKAGKKYETQTDENGEYKLSIPAGTYEISTKHRLIAWKTFEIPEYLVAHKATMNLDIVLRTHPEFTKTHGSLVTGTPIEERGPPIRDYLYFPTTLQRDKYFVEEATKVLRDNPKATITLVGHARKKKSVATNRLAILRRFLITDQSISPRRITTVYAGRNPDGPYTQVFVIDEDKSVLWRN